MVRIAINGQRTEVSVNRNVSVIEWNPRMQQLSGRTEISKEIHDYISITKSKMIHCYSKLEMNGQAITLQIFKNAYNGVSENNGC